TLKSPSYTKSVSWQHYPEIRVILRGILFQITVLLCQQAAAPLIVVMSPWISRTFLEAQKYPLAYIAQANKSSHFIFRVPPLTVADKCLLTQHLMQQKHREWVSL
ncbi:transposase, partial [Shigella flexneri]